ncbi:gliding motility-associated C-terminal domain-containing protein [Flavobacterium sp. ACN6]|uniref:gliding motility-associated C-terminal domain-containing protein n=1 Tax=Flavobacterium sp. ACN6 TaxID=1920426 RepID=UPI000BB34969|nr:gliding motility-associated C-terminal domain-containing protein [Flavobacterium sp. ACN6]PBJ04039.1 hypothetical protein BSF42_44570 [Flavobacterium sp. ACN6]
MKNIRIIVFFILSVNMSIKAQVVNIGEMVVNPNTVVGIVSDFDNQLSGTVLNDGEVYIWSDFKNEGLITFSPEQDGITVFEGKEHQKIEGNGSTGFQNLRFNKSSSEIPIELHTEISVALKAYFTTGIVSAEDYEGLLVFEKGAAHANTNNSSYFDGSIIKNGDEAFIFPTGQNGYYRNLEIAATKEVISSFKGSYYYKNSNEFYPHSNKAGAINLINENEYWVLERLGGNANAILTISWDELTTTPSAIAAAPLEEIHIVRWNADENIWVDEGGVVNEYEKTVSTPISVSGYGVFTLARVSISGIVPCNKLVVYNAVSANGDGLNDYFKIDGLKSCSDGNNKVQIYDRWGVKVYETNNYDENGNVFRGYSDAKNIIGGTKLLPAGTYFYVLTISGGSSSQAINKTGYLYLN